MKLCKAFGTQKKKTKRRPSHLHHICVASFLETAVDFIEKNWLPFSTKIKVDREHLRGLQLMHQQMCEKLGAGKKMLDRGWEGSSP